MTPVIFKMERNHGADATPVAFFPAEPWSANVHNECACYAHLGQHGAAAIDYAASLPPATPEQYAPLLAELRAIGYDDLKIIRKFTQAHQAARRASIAKLATG